MTQIKSKAIIFASAIMIACCVIVVNDKYVLFRRDVLPEGALEIRLSKGAIRKEGMGAVLSGMKGVLLIANATGAIVTAEDQDSGHGYTLSEYIHFSTPFPLSRKVCTPSVQPKVLSNRVLSECQLFNFSTLPSLGVFDDCDTLEFTEYLSHPRTCLAHSAQLVQRATKFQIPSVTVRKAICILRRGGDVERRIMEGKGNMWAIDEKYTLPILRKLRDLANVEVRLITETSKPTEVTSKYKPNVFSNKESLRKVVNHLVGCRCTFISAGSSFASSMMQIAPPDYIIYTVDANDFSFKGVMPYAYDEYGQYAISIRENATRIVELCARQSRR